MNYLDSFFLGVIQGITEFLPISSSGHLVLAQAVMGVSQTGILFEISVHLGTLLSILVVFYDDIKKLIITIPEKETRNMIGYIIVGTIPVVIIGLTMKDQVEAAFDNPYLIGYSFLFTGTVLLLTKISNPGTSRFTYFKSILIGLAQTIALLPGVSRSGMTISSALFLGIDSSKAAKYSFLLAIPALLGSGLLMIKDFISASGDNHSLGIMAVGFITSFIVGIAALKLLLRILVKGKFHWFGLYCIIIGAITLTI